ncbi:transposase family protein [Paucibacter sp. APW11]|uniref:Transposase family protein n=1 Tax=Roseateles aquae TaxID=3077235 RepID=A0ABU3PHA5_9BURK|nr:transposase family protein [Paucibacter sp. APW11]MDT9001952.1 transposase family protein [Paucibacter sp. APW11]
MKRPGFRKLNLIDEANREALCLEVGISIPSARLIRALNRLIEWYDAPDSVRMDNGPEMTSHDFIEWAAAKGVKLNHIEPGELNRPGFRGGSNSGEWSHEEVPEVFA